MKIQLENPTAIAINEALAAHPEADSLIAYGCEIKREECEREGLWRVCKDKIDANTGTIARGKEVSNHRTFAEAVAALDALALHGTILGQWTVYKGEQEGPWISAGAEGRFCQ